MGARGPRKGSEQAAAGKGYRRGRVAAGIPPPPAFLGKIGRAEYERLAAVMADTLTPTDHGPLTGYAQAYEEVALHTQELMREGYTVEGDRGCVLNPRVRALDLAEKRMIKGAASIGLTRKAASATPNVELQSGGARRSKSAHSDDANQVGEWEPEDSGWDA